VWRPLTSVACIILDEFTGYGVHRVERRLGFLWSGHLAHHSAGGVRMAYSARLSPVEGFYQPLVDLSAPLLGFPVAIYAPLTVASLIHLELQHTRVVGRLG
jgi:sterol desaturase/sphingolipid hydroxylase (fatty acid hydroxylase superfamily)